MPKPLLLSRRSGLYARFLVPLDLRHLVGSRFLVRPLHASGDGARLVAAHMGLSLSQSFAALRQGDPVDLKKALEAAAAIGRKELILKGVQLPNGARFEHVEIQNEQDRRMFNQAVDDIGRLDFIDRAALFAPSKPSGALLSKAIDDHLADLTTAKRDAKTVLESRHSMRLLIGIVGDRPVDEITQDHMRAFFAGVRWWPKNGSRRPENKHRSVLEIIEAAKAANEPEPAAHTLSKHRQRLAVFFNSLKSSRAITISPLEGLPPPKSAESETGRPFSQDELVRIFDPANFVPWAAKYPHRWWGPMLGLYTGARVNEIAQLYMADIETVHGVPGIHINKRFKGQKLKTKSSLRFVPLAQPLIDAGFLAYVDEARAAGHERLFPALPNSTGLGFGKQLTKQFSTYIKGLGIRDAGVGFHAFRHTFSTLLNRVGVDDRRIAALTGHLPSQSVLSRFYIDAPSVAEKFNTLRHFRPELKLPAPIL